MTDHRLQQRLPNWDLPEDLNQDMLSWEPEGLAQSEDDQPQDLRTTLQLDKEALFATARIEEKLAELKWESLPPQEVWYGER